MTHMQALEGSVLMVVDVQENHYPHCASRYATLDRMVRVVESAKILGVPIVLTEHYPKVFGPTVGPLREAIEGAGVKPFGKIHFSCLADEAIDAHVKSLGARRVVLVGTETHICICQTALTALDRGLAATVVADAVTARRNDDHDMALSRMRADGVEVLTWESLVYEWMLRGGTPEFRAVLPIVKK